MSTSRPIRDLTELQKLENYYYKEKRNLRNYTLICLGVNTTLRISDLLRLKWNDVYNFSEKCFKYYLTVTEQKTKKETRIALNTNAIRALTLYQKNLSEISEDMYLFPGRKGSNAPLSRSQAFRIIQNASTALHFEKGISCHSMRKTFGYHAWKCGTPPAVLMEIYNHSSYQITKRYLGIEQEDKDSVFFNVNL